MAKTKRPKKRGRRPVVPESLKRYIKEADFPAAKKAPRLLALLFCEYTNLTKEDKVNLSGIFDQIYANPETKRTGRFIVFVKTAETLDEEVWLRVIDPKNEPALEVKFHSSQAENRPENPNQMQLMLPIMLTVKQEGIYWFDVSYKGISLGGGGLSAEYKPKEKAE